MNFDLGLALLSEYDTDGFIGLQVDLFGEQNSGAPAFEMHSPYGFYSRPLDPDKDANVQATGNACTVLYAWEGSRGHVWPLGDPRVIPKLPPVSKGGSTQYGASGAFHVIDGGTGTQVLYVPYAFTGPSTTQFPNGSPTKSLSIELNVDTPGQESISLVNGEGMAITLSAGGKNSVVIKNKSGSAFFEVNDDGLIASGNLVVQGMMSAGQGGQPLALAAPIIAVLQQLITIITPIVGVSGTGAPAAALLSELATIAAKNAMSP